MKYGVRVSPDVIVRVEANSEEEARKIVKAELAKKEASKLYDQVYFDYETGINDPKLRGLLSTAEEYRDSEGNLVSEKELILENIFGSQGFTRDSKGNLAITPEGQRRYGLKPTSKNIVIDESGTTKSDYADFLGYAGPIVGAISFLTPQLRIARALTNLTFGKPRLARAIAAGAGSAAGKGVEEAAEVAAGLQLQDSKQIADMLQEEFAYGSVSQGAAEGLGALFKTYFGKTAEIGKIRDSNFIMEGYNLKDINRINREIAKKKGINDDNFKASYKEVKKELKKQKIKPTLTPGIVTQAALGRPLASRIQTVGEAVVGGSGREKKVIRNLEQQIAEIFDSLGRKDISITNFVDASTAGGTLSTGARVAYDDLLKAIDSTDVKQDALFKLLLDEMGQIRNYGDPVVRESVERGLGQAIEDSYTAWRATNKKLYDEATKAMDSDAVLTNGIKETIRNESQVFKELLDQARLENPILPASPGYNILSTLENVSEKNAIETLQNLINVRKDFIGKNIALAAAKKSSSQIYQINKKIIDKIDSMFKDIETGGGFIKASNLTGPEKETLQKTLKLWKAAQKDYAINIGKYDNLVVQGIIRQIQNGSKNVNVDELFGQVVRKNNKKNLDGVLQAIRKQYEGSKGQYYFDTDLDKVRQITSELQRLLFKNVLQETTDPTTGLVNIPKFVKEIRSYGDTLKTLFGPKYDQNMNLLRELVSLNPRITSKEISQIITRATEKPGETILAAQKQLETIVPELDTANKILANLEDKAKLLRTKEQLDRTQFMKAVNSKTPDEVVGVLFRPGAAKEIETAKRMLGPERFAEVQENAMGQLLTRAVTVGDLKSTAKLSDIFKPNNLRSAMESYGDDTLIEMFGRDTVDGLKALDEAIQLQVAAGKGNQAGSIVAGYIGVNALDLAIMPTVVGLKVLTTLLSNPTWVKLMARTDKGAIAQTLELFERTARFYLTQEVQTGAEIAQRNIEEARAEIQRQLRSPEALEQRKKIEQSLAPIQQQYQQQKLELDLPNVIGQVSPPSQGIVSQSLLGGSPANIDIAQSLGRLA